MSQQSCCGETIDKLQTLFFVEQALLCCQYGKVSRNSPQKSRFLVLPLLVRLHVDAMKFGLSTRQQKTKNLKLSLLVFCL